MRGWLDAHKPAGSARVHLLLAAMMWTLVGTVLLLFGVCQVPSGHLASDALLLVLAVAAGWVKGRFVLDRAAGRVIERIRTRGDRRCIGGFLSLRTWALVALMMVAGRTLRGSLVPGVIVGLVYAAVGTALLVASRRLWQASYRCGTGV